MTPTHILTIDLPTLHRRFIGFDHVFEELNRTFNTVKQDNYPPHNIIKIDDDHYEIQFAVAGFRMEEIDITVESNVLSIRGTKIEEEDNRVYLHRGLAARDFEQHFTLAEYMNVKGAEVKDGMLKIEIERIVPEALKPRTIEIK